MGPYHIRESQDPAFPGVRSGSKITSLQDLLFDCASMWDLSRLEIHIVEARSPAGPMGSAGDGGSSLWGGAWALGGTYKAVSTGAWSTIPPEPPSTSKMTKEPKTGYAKGILP